MGNRTHPTELDDIVALLTLLPGLTVDEISSKLSLAESKVQDIIDNAGVTFCEDDEEKLYVYQPGRFEEN